MVPELAKVLRPNVAFLQGTFLPEPRRKLWSKKKDPGLGIRRLMFKYHFCRSITSSKSLHLSEP